MAEVSAGAYFRTGTLNLNMWLLFIQYACCFGVELTMNNAAASHAKPSGGPLFRSFAHKMYLLNHSYTHIAGVLLQVDLRTEHRVGGRHHIHLRLDEPTSTTRLTAKVECADASGGRPSASSSRAPWSSYSPIQPLSTSPVSAPKSLFFAIDSAHHDALLILTHFFFSLVLIIVIFSSFVQAAEGSSYGIVPYVNPPVTGSIDGIVGAGGNTGAVCFGLWDSASWRQSRPLCSWNRASSRPVFCPASSASRDTPASSPARIPRRRSLPGRRWVPLLLLPAPSRCRWPTRRLQTRLRRNRAFNSGAIFLEF